MRTGIGYDIHRLIPTLEKSAIALGGAQIPCFFKVKAHSDGDVLLHAIVDAMLGALALGDIGQWFPDNKAVNQNRASSEFLTEVATEVRSRRWAIENIDTIVFLEEPKLAPFSDAVRQTIARLLDLELHQVSLKAKTMEGFGPIGEGKALAAQAIVTLIPKLG